MQYTLCILAMQAAIGPTITMHIRNAMMPAMKKANTYGVKRLGIL